MPMTMKIAEKIAEKRDWMVNPDRTYAQQVIDGLNANKKERGHYYCPCKVFKGIPDLDKKIICPCKDAPKEMAEAGLCHCGLYVKPYIFTCPNCGDERDERKVGSSTPPSCPACGCPLTSYPEAIREWKERQKEKDLLHNLTPVPMANKNTSERNDLLYGVQLKHERLAEHKSALKVQGQEWHCPLCGDDYELDQEEFDRLRAQRLCDRCKEDQ